MKRVVTFGEIMLRLSPPGHELFLQTPAFGVAYGGAEANVAVALANFGMDAAFVTALPKNALGEAARTLGRPVALLLPDVNRGPLAEQLPSLWERVGPRLLTLWSSSDLTNLDRRDRRGTLVSSLMQTSPGGLWTPCQDPVAEKHFLERKPEKIPHHSLMDLSLGTSAYDDPEDQYYRLSLDLPPEEPRRAPTWTPLDQGGGTLWIDQPHGLKVSEESEEIHPLAL